MVMSAPALFVALSLSTVPCVSAPAENVARGSRPTLSGTEQIVRSQDGLFALHFTQEGEDRLQSVQDLNADGLPDVVDEVLSGLETARSAYVARGYRDVVRDAGGGGGPELDVYIVDLANNGFANAVPAEAEEEPWSCYIRLAADLTSQGGELLESVAAHELNHCVQYRYTTNSDTWIYESAATFEQYGLYESGLLELALQVLWGTRLSGAGRPLDDVGNRFEYAGFSWWKFWTEFQPGVERMVPFWEALASEPRWRQTLDAQALDLWELTLPEVFLEFSTWNAFACARDDGGHYAQDVMPCLLENVSVPVTSMAAEQELVVVLDSGDYTSATLELDDDGGGQSPSVQCELSEPQAEVLVRLIGLDQHGRRGPQAEARLEQSGQIDLRLDEGLVSGGRAIVVLASVGEAAATISCVARFVEPLAQEPGAAVGDGCQCSTSSWAGTGSSLLVPWLLAWVLLRRRG
jgi:hypothetical protein